MSMTRLSLADGQLVNVNVRAESTVIMLNEQTMFTFDPAGRLHGAFVNGAAFRRSFTNEILEKRAGAETGLSTRQRRFLSTDEVQALENRAYALAANALQTRDAVAEETLAALTRIANYNYERLEQEREVFQQIYKPITILPPDQYLALYLQATEGCTYDECTFCGFYRDRKFRAKTLDEFREHTRAVREFFGPALALRRSIFLGDANALVMPQRALISLFDLVQETFSITPSGLARNELATWKAAHPLHFNGIFSFIDAFTSHRKTTADFRALAERGLRRVYIGVETGDAELLHFLGKPATPADVAQLVTTLKDAGVAVGLIILIGAGGQKFKDGHTKNTVELVNALPLDQNDLIYFSELVDYAGSTYASHASAAGIAPLTGEEILEQEQRLRAGFSFKKQAPKVSYYDLREFIY